MAIMFQPRTGSARPIGTLGLRPRPATPRRPRLSMTPLTIPKPRLSRYGRIRKPSNYLCLHCGKVCIAPQGIGSHLSGKHGVHKDDTEEGIDWNPTSRIAV